MSTHTPGPWRRMPYLDSGNPSLTIQANPDGRGWQDIGSARGWAGDGEDQAGRNADLFAAAPDMLTALRELERRTRQYLAGDLVTFPAALLPQVRAVIEAAEGRAAARSAAEAA